MTFRDLNLKNPLWNAQNETDHEIILKSLNVS